MKNIKTVSIYLKIALVIFILAAIAYIPPAVGILVGVDPYSDPNMIWGVGMFYTIVGGLMLVFILPIFRGILKLINW